jgi:hypothetical protein
LNKGGVGGDGDDVLAIDSLMSFSIAVFVVVVVVLL